MAIAQLVHDVCRKIGWEKNPKAFSSFTLSQAVMSRQHFVEKGKKLPGKHGMFTLKHLQFSKKLVCIDPLLVMRNKKFLKSLLSPCMTDLVRPQTLMLSDSICLPRNKGHTMQFLQLRQLWFNILSELHIGHAVFGVSQHYVKWNLKALVNVAGRSKVTLPLWK